MAGSARSRLPEGPNIGLINSLASFSRVNKYGFIETPYRKVVDHKVTKDVVYLSAMEEAKHTIAQANAELTKDNSFGEEIVSSPPGRRVPDGAARDHHPDGRLAQAARLGRRLAHSVPRE